MLPQQNTELWPGWETVGILGQGSFGAVYEIRRDVFGEEEKAALKVISIPQSKSELDEMYGEGYDEASIQKNLESQLKSIVSEYSLMRKLNGCANVVHCDDVRYEPKPEGIGWNIYIKMELLTPLMKGLALEISEKAVVRIGKEMCNALEYCEHYGIIHRDIKPQNMFLNDRGECKLGDFGIAKTIEKTSGGTKIGTFKYMAPEVYNNHPYGSAADIYSLGLVLYWLLNERRMPFVPLPPAPVLAGVDGDAANKRLSGMPIPAPKNGSDGLKRIVLKACAFDPKERYNRAAEMRKALEDLERTLITPQVSHPELSGDATVAVRKVAPPPVSVPHQPPVAPPAAKPRTITPPTPTPPPAPPVEQKKSKKGILVIAILLFVLLAGGITAFFLFGPGKKPTDTSSSISDDSMVTVFLLTEVSSADSKGIYEYNDDGKILSRISYDEGVETYRQENEYDDKGNLTQEVYYENGIESDRYEYEYDDKGNLMQDVCYKHGVESHRYEFEYDDKGNQMLMVCSQNGVESYRYEFEYDDKGNLIQKVYYKDGVGSDRYEFEYDDKGNQIQEVHYENGVESDRHEYEYDDNGNLMQTVLYRAGKESGREEYEYDDKGNQILKVGSKNGVESHRTESAYDDNSNLIQEVYYYEGTEYSRYEYEYDNNGTVKTFTITSSGEKTVYNTTYQAFRMKKSEAEALTEEYPSPQIIIQD